MGGELEINCDGIVITIPYVTIFRICCPECEWQHDTMTKNTDFETKTGIQILATPNSRQDLRQVPEALFSFLGVK